MKSSKPVRIVSALMTLTVVLCSHANAADSRQYSTASGSLTEDRFGVAVSKIGDLNADGYADLLVGARYADVGSLVDAGSVSCVSGKDGTELFRLSGDAAGDWFGVSLASLGDVTGDGVPEFVVGAQFAKRSDGTQTGAAYIYSGATATRLYSLYGDNADARFGVAVGGGQDVDGDGIPDAIVGAYIEGSAYLYSGANGRLIAKLPGVGTAWYGFAVSLFPDLNGDGISDIAVSAPKEGAGSVYVYSGSNRSLLYKLSGEVAGDWFGFAIADANDLTGDKRSEIIIGAREASPNGKTYAGSVYIYEGKTGTLLSRVDGAGAKDAFGTSISSAGDINRDGVPDLLIGARFALNASGVVTGGAYLLSGTDYSVITKVFGENSQDWFGGSVTAVGDINGDGWPEWAVGAAGHDPAGRSNAGKAYLFGLIHNDIALTALSAPRSAKAGESFSVGYTAVNHGEPGTITTTLTINGVKKLSAAARTLDFMASQSGSFSYALSASEFISGRATVCVNTAISGITDGYTADNSKCSQVAQKY